VCLADLLYRWGAEDFIEMLGRRVSAGRLNELRPKIANLDKKGEYKDDDFWFLSETEGSNLQSDFMERRDIDSYYCLAHRTVKADDGRELRFEIHINCEGEGYDLKTPYEERDGKFVDLTDCRISYYSP
jgi:hypothetical protein